MLSYILSYRTVFEAFDLIVSFSCLVADQAWVTLVTNDTYALGALVLGHSLIRAGTKRATVVLVTPQVSASMRYVVTVA